MAEYTRKKRYINYNHSLCKKYLRIDFQYKCAYCGRHEAEAIDGPGSFEIDHFKPHERFKHLPEINNYDNLFYSCTLCNGKTGKGDKWEEDLLNPCVHDIFGMDFHIRPEHDEKFKLIHITGAGEKFISIFNLNQKKHRDIRKSRQIHKLQILQMKEEIKAEFERRLKLLDELESKNGCIDLSGYREKLNNDINEIDNRMLGGYYYNIDSVHYFDEEQEEKFEKLLPQFIQIKKVYGEHDLQYELQYKSATIKGNLIIEDNISFIQGKKQKRISIGQAIDWKALDDNMCMFLFNKEDGKTYYCNIKDVLNRSTLDESAHYFTVSFEQTSEICESNKDVFLKDIFG